MGDTDSYTIIQNGYTEDKLIFEIKLAALLYDVVFIPAAYMWQSYQMKEIMYKIQPLILTENVLPVRCVSFFISFFERCHDQINIWFS